MRKALRSLPRTLDETYERILLGIRPEYQQEAISALTWLVFSKRPLTVAELAEGSVIDITSTIKKPFEADERLFNPNSIVDILSGLVSATTNTSGSAKIRLAHFSVEEYLVSERIMGGPASTFQLSFLPSVQSLLSACLYYLLSPDLHSESGRLPEKFPLLEYAAKYWPIYAKDCQGSTPKWLMDVIFSFFECKDGFQMWQETYFRGSSRADSSDRGCSSLWGDRYASRLDVHLPPFYYASRLGMTDVVQRFLDMDSISNDSTRTQPRTLPGLYANELRAACHFGHEDVVFMLLNAGADHSAVGGRFGTALSASMHTESPNERILGRLLEIGSRLHTSDFLTGWIMRWAVGHGHLRIVNLLLEIADGLDPAFGWTKRSTRHFPHPGSLFEGVYGQKFGPEQQQSYESGCSSPYQAVFLGHSHIVQRLIDDWDYVNEEDNHDRTALYWAAFHGDENIVRLLLQKGARPDVTVREYGWRPADWAIEWGNECMMALLQEKGEASSSSKTVI